MRIWSFLFLDNMRLPSTLLWEPSRARPTVMLVPRSAISCWLLVLPLKVSVSISAFKQQPLIDGSRHHELDEIEGRGIP